jgi:hypothetical protein
MTATALTCFVVIVAAATLRAFRADPSRRRAGGRPRLGPPVGTLSLARRAARRELLGDLRLGGGAFRND